MVNYLTSVKLVFQISLYNVIINTMLMATTLSNKGLKILMQIDGLIFAPNFLLR